MLNPPRSPISMLDYVTAKAKTQTSVFFSTIPCPIKSGVNIEFGGAGVTYIPKTCKTRKRFFSRDGNGNACLQIHFARFVDMLIFFEDTL